MKFLYPEFLFGLFTLAIPVIIHLFNFRKSKKLFFSSTRFLDHIKKTTSKKRRLKHYLILFSRLLFLLFLVLAFAQPYFPQKNKNPQAQNVLVYLDNSSSMSNQVGNTSSSLNLGLEYLERLLDLYPTNTSYKFLTNDFAPSSNTLKSKNETDELLTEVRISTISRSLPEVYARLTNDPTEQVKRDKDVFLISDFQKSTIGNLQQLPFDSADQVFIVPIAFDQTANVFIDSVFLSDPFLVAGQNNQLHAILRNHGLEDAQEVPLKLFINEIQTSGSVVNIPAGGSQEVTFELGFNLEKINKCRISIEDYPVTFDNDFYFVLRLENKINIFEIRENEQSSSISQVYGNANLFNYSGQDAKNINYSMIRQSDLVILNGLDAIDNSLSVELTNHVSNGRSVLLIPGTKPAMESYQNLIPSIRTIPPDSAGIAVAMPDLSNPFFENIFESTDANFEMPIARTLLRWSGQQSNLLLLRNNQDFLSAFRREGYVFLLASPLMDDYTNLHRHALFVPLMYRMASLSKQSIEPPYYTMNQSVIILKLDSLNKQDIFKLRNEAGDKELIPNQRISGNELILEMPKNELQPGFYNLSTGGSTRFVMAFNLDSEESLLEQMKVEEIKAIFASEDNVNILEVNDADNFTNEIKKNKFGIPLWKYAIILALLFLLAEVLLIRFL